MISKNAKYITFDSLKVATSTAEHKENSKVIEARLDSSKDSSGQQKRKSGDSKII